MTCLSCFPASVNMTCKLHHKTGTVCLTTLSRCMGCWGFHPEVHLNAWPGFATPHLVHPSVCPVSQLLASLTLLQPKLLKHDAPSHKPSPASSPRRPSPSLTSELLLLCLFAWLPACQYREPRNPSMDRHQFITNPHGPSPYSGNIWKTTRICLTVCTREHVNDSVKWETKNKKKKVQRVLGFCNKLVTGKRRKLFLSFAQITL